ncbi:PREDICTED: melanoma-associated antigen B1-like [Chinchilla lanigera]|uniref:melanoma-associated antigen B1-like n=1 Tax=Chinchilla lanigera TaxID=34839 RepID=UPI00038EFCE4|nr:PREDICTED: melanoma-associated antigen B1-like [Chinchilla lanigera]XP_005410192.1 PREDICTED: melanoma-associated antigen B1-like [Chinchilla lanigera]
MPRGHKSKVRAQEKRRQAQSETQFVQDAPAAGAQGGEAPSCSALSAGAAASSSVAGLPQKSQGAAPTSSSAGAATPKKSGKGAKSKRKEWTTFPMPTIPTESSEKELLMRKSGMLMHYLLYKYQMKEKVMRGEMLTILNRKLRQRFSEILQLTSEWADLLFGLELKEVKPGGGSYTLIKKFSDSKYGRPVSGLDIPMNGLLMPLLGAIFLKGRSASEEEIWEFLNMMGIYDAKQHIIFGEPRKFITKDLVQKKFLVYRQVLHSDPPRYEFLWGPRAHAEISKMKVLEFLAKVNETVPTAFPIHYAEALRDKQQRAQAKAAASNGTAAQSIPGPRGTSTT